MEKRGGEETVSTEGTLLHFFSYTTVCIAYARKEVLYEHIEHTVFKGKHWMKYLICC